jgi:hypothetical protein
MRSRSFPGNRETDHGWDRERQFWPVFHKPYFTDDLEKNANARLVERERKEPADA